MDKQFFFRFNRHIAGNEKIYIYIYYIVKPDAFKISIYCHCTRLITQLFRYLIYVVDKSIDAETNLNKSFYKYEKMIFQQ